MLKKKICGFFVIAALLVVVAPAWAGGGTNIKGADVTIGNWWQDYNVNTFKPDNERGEKELAQRQKVLKDTGSTIQVKNIAGWSEMQQLAATSIMAGRPAAQVFILQPDWAMALYGRDLLYPIGDSKAVDWASKYNPAKKDLPNITWSQPVRQAFTIKGKTYGFTAGIGESLNAQVVFFNKRLFREAGLDPNLPYDLQKAGTWNWENFLDIARKLTRDIDNDGVMDTFALPADLSTEIFDALISGNGGQYVDRDSTGRFVNATDRPEFVEAIQFYIRMRDEGVMKPKPEGANWDWYKSEFNDGKVAMRIDEQYVRGELRNMTDDWGMVLPPKGPKAKNNDYSVFTRENIMVVPKHYNSAQVDQIVYAAALWFSPPDDDWRAGAYNAYRDRRAVDETEAMIRDEKYFKWKNHLFIPGLQRGDIAWQIWWHDGDPAQLIEAVSQNWNALIADANELYF